MSARDRIMGRVRAALMPRSAVPHPGDFRSWRPTPPPPPVLGFRALFESAGGEVVHLPSDPAAVAWLADFSATFPTVVVGEGVPPDWVPDLERAPADRAALGISRARAAVAETGSLVLDARDGRRAQLLAPTHVVIVHAGAVVSTLRELLVAAKDDLTSAIGLHSGPSKSADIGQVMVKGVHGPGRVVALIVGPAP